MTDATIALLEYLRKFGLDQDKDFLQESIRLMSQLLMEVENQIYTARLKPRIGHSCSPSALFSPLHVPKLAVQLF